MDDSRKDDLQDQVMKFQTGQLPGQPMGTLYLVNALWREVLRLRAAVVAAGSRHE